MQAFILAGAYLDPVRSVVGDDVSRKFAVVGVEDMRADIAAGEGVAGGGVVVPFPEIDAGTGAGGHVVACHSIVVTIFSNVDPVAHTSGDLVVSDGSIGHSIIDGSTQTIKVVQGNAITAVGYDIVSYGV